MGPRESGPLAAFCAALDSERERAGLTQAYIGQQLGLSPSTVNDLFQGNVRKAPPWERVSRILELCRDATHRLRPGNDGHAAVAALAADRRDYLQEWRIRHGVLIHELDAARRLSPEPSPPPTPTVHCGHTLLGSIPLICRAEDSARLAEWNAESSGPNVLCLTGPGGQGKSALAWTHLTGDAAVGAVRVWHGFGGEPDPARALTATLARAARQAFGTHDDDESAAALLRRRMSAEGGTIVLDAVEHLYGPSGRLLDTNSSKFRTIADPRVEDLIRELIALRKVKILLVCRLTPAFLDDPAVGDQTRRLDLGPIRAGASAPFWKHMDIRGTVGELATATAALRGSPVLMRLVASRVLRRRSGEISAWLTTEQARISRIGDSDVIRRLVPQQIMDDLADTSRKLLLLLAVSRRRLSEAYWRDLAAGRVRRFLRAGQSGEPSREEIEVFDEAVFDLQENDLIHRDDAGDFDLHELLADAVIATAGEDELDEAYHKLVAAEGLDLYRPGSGWHWEQLEGMAAPERIATNTGRFRSLLDRDALDSASHILNTELYPALRYRVCDLRQLRELAARLQAALARRGSATAGRSVYDVELALADGDWEEAIVLLGDDDRRGRDSSYFADRAEAKSGRGEFAEAHRDASAACFHAWRASRLEEAVDGYAYLMDEYGTRALQNVSYPCQGYHFAVAAQLVLSRVLRRAGFRRTALLVLIDSFPLGHSHPGELGSHWEECGILLAELGQPALARRACDLALSHARADKSQEQMLRARTLEMELLWSEGGRPDPNELSSVLVDVTRLGFGVLARRLLAHYPKRDGLFKAVAWQYQVDPSSPPQPPPAADDLPGELALLAESRLPGQWAELALLESVVKRADDGRAIVADGLLERAWQSVVGEAWAKHARSWLNGWKSDASPHLTALHRLDLLENDRAAARTLATTWTESDPGQVFERLVRAVFYEPDWLNPDEKQVRDAMVLAARASGRLHQAAWTLGRIMAAGWQPAETALQVAGLYRELGDYDRALLVSLAGSEDANNRRRPGGRSEVVVIALILGAGMDLLASGGPPDGVVDAVQNGLSGRPMIGNNPFGSGIRVIGEDSEPETAQREEVIGGTFGVAQRLEPGTAWHAALELFRKIAGSDGTGRAHEASLAQWLERNRLYQIVPDQDPNADATARAALARVHGHHALISRLHD